MHKTILAIDPGASGGFAWQIPGGTPAAIPMPETEGDILEQLRSIAIADHLAVKATQLIAFVEQVGGFIQGNPAPGSAMFNFGRNYGFLIGALMALGYRVELVRPQKWQAAIGLPKSGGDKAEHKRRMKEKAQQLYPNCKVTLKTADALLLLEFGKQAA